MHPGATSHSPFLFLTPDTKRPSPTCMLLTPLLRGLLSFPHCARRLASNRPKPVSVSHARVQSQVVRFVHSCRSLLQNRLWNMSTLRQRQRLSALANAAAYCQFSLSCLVGESDCVHGTDDDVAGTAGRHGLTFAALLQRLEREFAGLAEETTLSLGKCISATARKHVLDLSARVDALFQALQTAAPSAGRRAGSLDTASDSSSNTTSGDGDGGDGDGESDGGDDDSDTIEVADAGVTRALDAVADVSAGCRVGAAAAAMQFAEHLGALPFVIACLHARASIFEAVDTAVSSALQCSPSASACADDGERTHRLRTVCIERALGAIAAADAVLLPSAAAAHIHAALGMKGPLPIASDVQVLMSTVGACDSTAAAVAALQERATAVRQGLGLCMRPRSQLTRCVCV